ncbi:hypothetical protein P8452_74959 [Trifolium repens]|nr:hypothetical protein P8452_74959 [Trifolium repens]
MHCFVLNHDYDSDDDDEEESPPSDTTQGLMIAVKGHSGIVRPRNLEAANKKRLHSLGLQQAPSTYTCDNTTYSSLRDSSAN